MTPYVLLKFLRYIIIYPLLLWSEAWSKVRRERLLLL